MCENVGVLLHNIKVYERRGLRRSELWVCKGDAWFEIKHRCWPVSVSRFLLVGLLPLRSVDAISSCKCSCGSLVDQRHLERKKILEHSETLKEDLC